MRVLVPIDGSDESWAAFKHAISRDPEAVIALHVIDPMTALETGDPYTSYDRFVNRGQERAEGLFGTVAEIVAESTIDASTVDTDTAIGSPIREILEYVSEHDIDHIIMGSRGRSGISRVLLGSVAESVARRSPVPVTVIR